MNRFAAFSASLTLCAGIGADALADADASTDTPSQDEGSGEATPSGFRNVDIVESGRFRMRDKRDYRDMIILGPRFIPPGINVRYDHLFGDNLSLVLGTGFGRMSVDAESDGESSETVTLSSWRILAGMNWHPVRNGMHGFFLGPRLEYEGYKVSVSGSGDDGSVSNLSGGAVVGWRWIWDPGFSLGLGVGGGYQSIVAEADAVDEDGSDIDVDFNFSGFWPIVEFTLGWAF